MTKEDRQGVSLRRLVWCCLIPLIFLLLIFLLPVVLKSVVNRIVLPHVLSDPKLPPISGSVDELNYRNLVTGSFTIDAAPGIVLTIPKIKAAYSPGSLLRKRVHSVEGLIVSAIEPVFEAGFQARDIKLRPGGGVEALLSAQCSKIQFGEYSAGPIEFSEQVQGTDAIFSFDVPIQDGLLSTRIDVEVDWKTNPVWTCSAVLPLCSADGSPVQLASLGPEVNDLLLAGNLRVDAEGSEASMKAAVHLEVDSLEMPEHSLELKNLVTDCALQLRDEPRSLPEQKLTVESVAIGELLLEQINMRYQLEPESVFYIEELAFNLCGGQMRLNNTRIRPDMSHLLFRLSCERLSLEQVLTACGVKSFSGDGELNGRLPVEWHDGSIQISNGFLFSTPGKGGVFSMGGAQAAAGLLPVGVVAESQIGLVSDALAEFRYDWMTMTMNSEGEDLKITVEMAGSPVHILPYKYDARRGTYMKISLKKPGQGIRQPMQFKLNLSVPLNQLLCYASGINRQWNLFQGK
jgi:hypothetical protein